MRKKYIFMLLSLTILLVGCKGKEALKEEDVILDKEVVGVDFTEKEEVLDVEEKSLVELIEEKVNEIIGNYKDNVAIYFKNMNTNEEYTLNENTYYVAASTNKIPLSMMILDDVNNGNKSLNDILYFREEDREGGSGTLYYLDKVPNLTIGEAIYLSIVDSDNIAKNMLTRVASTSVTDYMRYITNDNDIPYGNYITAKQLGILLNNLYENQETNKYYTTLIDYMTKTNYHDRLDKYIDYDKVAHKIGNYYRYYHDAGIIYGEDPYVLVILTKDIGELSNESYDNGGEDERFVLDWGEEACELIAKISKEIYTLVEVSKK
ncbi:serine hydrolase [Clostridium nigeriense]|uniref:serine hydrolase n=1 Tax=Clostridium nigeriense TaxID=1805470 RepID=UPI000A4A3446|nr:serine hydrolase [Clostridium nigeriense]